MKINKAIEKIMTAKDINNQKLSDTIYPDKFMNISRMLMSDNMTVETILKLITPLGYNLILQPSEVKKVAYQISIDFSENMERINLPCKVERKPIGKMLMDNVMWYCLEDICSCIGAKTINAFSTLAENEKKISFFTKDSRSIALHFVTETGMNTIIENFSIDRSPALTELDFQIIEIVESSEPKTTFDCFSKFVEDCCLTDMQSSVAKAPLYLAYANWSKSKNWKPYNDKYFHEYLAGKYMSKNGLYLGIKLKMA